MACQSENGAAEPGRTVQSRRQGRGVGNNQDDTGGVRSAVQSGTWSIVQSEVQGAGLGYLSNQMTP